MAMSRFEVGVAVRDITPQQGAPLWGYSARDGGATDTLDPLYAKALAFKGAGGTVALVALDLGRVPMEAVRTRINERAKESGIDFIFFSATHTHHAPVMEHEDRPYMTPIETAIGDAIDEAAAGLRPARLGIGATEFDIAHNRRRVTDDGRCEMLWRNASRRPTKPLDREATLVRLEGEDGAPLATLIHYACHPVVMGPSNNEYSADYVGELTRLTEERLGAPCLFLQGAAGDINPYLDKTRIDEGAVQSMRDTGKACADKAIPALKLIETHVPDVPAVAFAEPSVEVGTRWDFSDPAQRKVYESANSVIFNYYVKDLPPDLSVPLPILTLCNELVLVGIPGEPFVRHQLLLKQTGPVRNTLLCGYVNGYYSYFPTLRDALAGGYGGTVASYVGLGAAEKLILEAHLEAARLLGRAEAPCTAADFEITGENA
jgi:neutral/alkaline ceramidase-like enzyme